MSSTRVFQLRKDAKLLAGVARLNILNEALDIANRSYAVEPDDEWNQKALAYTLIDLCKYYIDERNMTQATQCYDRLLSIDFEYVDDIIESQKNFLRPKFELNYSDVQRAETLSKNGEHESALSIFKMLITENRLSELNHESYGWVLYRYIKFKENDLTSIQVRSYLKEYMDLQNERPSVLHSTILGFALHYSKNHADFNLYKFFKLWGAANLRNEDKEKQSLGGKEIPSLLSRICREFVDKNMAIEVSYLLENIHLTSWVYQYTYSQQILDLLREPFFWKLLNAHKETKPELWHFFDQYNLLFSNYERSKWHSEILSLAERYMQEVEEWRFPDFFKDWNPDNLRDEDWKETRKDEHTYKPLAVKCVKKSFDAVTKRDKLADITWLLSAYSKAIELFPDDIWLQREKALLLVKINELEKAVAFYRKIVLELGDKCYIWNEFSSCINSNADLKLGMLSKAIQLEQNEDYLGDIRLELAKIFLGKGLVENCLVELANYKTHRDFKGWKITDGYKLIAEQTQNQITNLKDNKSIYNRFIPIAEHFAYEDIPWTEVVLVDSWKNEDGKEKVTFTDGKSVDLAVSRKRFQELKKATIGKIYRFKLHRQEVKKEVEGIFHQLNKRTITEYKYVALMVENSDIANWSVLDDVYAVVDYINSEKKVVHAITTDNKEVFFSQGEISLEVNDFVQAKYYIKKIKNESRIEFRDIHKIDKAAGIECFPRAIAVIDSINREKSLFHFVANRAVQGIIRFSEWNIVPQEGKFIDIRFASKKDRKSSKTIYKVIDAKESEESKPELMKSIQGYLELKYKKGSRTIDAADMDEEELLYTLPDFGFIGDFYVPKQILNNFKIYSNCAVKGTAIFAGDKWKVINLEKIQDAERNNEG